MFIRYPPARIRYEGDKAVALLGVRIAPSYRLVDLPLGTPLFLQAVHEAAARYHQLAGAGLTSREPREIVRAAEHGRVDTLFAAQQPVGPSADGSGVPVSDEGSGLQDLRDLATVIRLTNRHHPRHDRRRGWL